MPTPSDTIGQSQTLPNVPVDDVSNPFVTTQCPPEARPPPRPSPGEDHGLLDLPTPPQDLWTANANTMPRIDDLQQSVSDTSQENLDSPGVFVRESQRIVAAIEAQPGSTDVPNGVTTHAGSRVTSREQYGGIGQEGAGISQSLDSLRLLEAARQEESEILPEAAITRARGPSLFQSLSRRRPLIPEPPQGTPVVSAETGATRYVRWPVTSNIPPALLEATRAQLHRSERLNLAAAEAQNVEEALRMAYQTLQDHPGAQQLRPPDNNHARAADGGDSSPMSQRSTMSQTHHGDCSTPGQGVVEAQPASDPVISSHRADIFARRVRRGERRTTLDLHPSIPWSRRVLSRATDHAHSAAVTPPSSTTPSILSGSSKTRHPVLPGHDFGRYQPSSLHAGATFVGTQCSDRQEYNVKVEIKYVDMDDSFLCGHLIIEGLTQDHPKLETYFEAEIIGDKYEFATRHPDWGSSEKQDMLHWNRFAAWKPLYRPYRQPESQNPEVNTKDFAERENIFMRWKEYFLVPDHRVTAISGASFEGFYYICFNQRRASFSGIYYHAKSERWQQLELKHVASESRGCMPAVELA